jgi:hypothetical protein
VRPLSLLNEYDVAKAALVIKNILIARRQHMSNYIQKVTDSLTNLISDLSENPSLFVKNPSTDFTRNRKINCNYSEPLVEFV